MKVKVPIEYRVEGRRFVAISNRNRLASVLKTALGLVIVGMIMFTMIWASVTFTYIG